MHNKIWDGSILTCCLVLNQSPNFKNYCIIMVICLRAVCIYVHSICIYLCTLIFYLGFSLHDVISFELLLSAFLTWQNRLNTFNPKMQHLY